RTGYADEPGIGYPGNPTSHGNAKLTRTSHSSGRHRLLESLRDRLVSGGPEGAQVALEGINGVGKTHIALEYAYRFAAAYDIVWWISAEQPARVRTTLAELGTHLLIGGGATPDEQGAAAEEHLPPGGPAPPRPVRVGNS